MKNYLSPDMQMTEFLSDSVILSNSIDPGYPIIHPNSLDWPEDYRG